MKTTLQKEDICEVFTDQGFVEVCREMDWEVFTPTQADFIHEGWRVSIEHEIADGTYAPMREPWMRITPQRKAMLKQHYTQSMRIEGKSCSECIFRKNDACSLGSFKVKMNGGCRKFKQ
jgi:hypothetical protein